MRIKLWCESGGSIDGVYVCVYGQRRSPGHSITVDVEPQEEIVRKAFGPNETKMALPPYFIVAPNPKGWKMVGCEVVAHYGAPGGETGPHKIDVAASMKRNDVIGVVIDE